MLIKYTPKVEHIKVVVLTPKEGLELSRDSVTLLPGTNEVTDDEWKAMRGNITAELNDNEIVILAQKVGDGRGKPGGRKAKNLKDMPVNIAVKYVSECENPDTLIKWYKEITKEEVRLAITKRMKALEIDTPEDEIPEAPNAAPMSLDEFDEDEAEELEDEDLENDEDSDEDFEEDSEDEEPEVEKKDYESMKVAELKKECEEKGIDVTDLSKKADYIDALNSFDKE